MKLSVKWLQEFVTINKTPVELAKQLTSIGFEVESIEGDIIEIAVPPNRGDCLSILGLAREVAAINNLSIKPNKSFSIKEDFSSNINNIIKITVNNDDVCPKYLARVIKNVNAKVKTPNWIIERLLNCGMKSISAIVDIANYVMLELGQPLHTFDLDRISKVHNTHAITIRMANNNEAIDLLNNTTVKLSDSTLVIADNQGPLAIAGIMGGKSSEITEDTQNILIECAFFAPINIRLDVQRYKFSTDASYRFERGVDPNITQIAMNRITQLLLEIVGGQAGDIIEKTSINKLPQVPLLQLRRQRIKDILGILPEDIIITNILQRLDMLVTPNFDIDGWSVVAPSFRHDITAEIDLIEEIARHIGYDSIPLQQIYGNLSFKQHPEERISNKIIKNYFMHRGYHEAINYSFIDQELLTLFNPNEKCLELINPISQDMSVMRLSLLPGLVKTVQYNQHRQNTRVRLFEIGLRFFFNEQTEQNDLQQQQTLAFVIAGNNLPEHWDHNTSITSSDFFDIKIDVENLFKIANNLDKISFESSQHPAMHPLQCSIIKLNNRKIGILGALHPKLLKYFDLHTKIYLCEINYSDLVNGSMPQFHNLSKYPSIRRDLALIVDAKLPIIALQNVITEIVGNLLQDIKIFDIYQGDNIAPDKKSVGIGLILQHTERTLLDHEINLVIEKIIAKVKLDFNAILR